MTIACAPSAGAIAREIWTRLCPDNHPFLNPDFLSIIEQRGAAAPQNGWRARHLLAGDEGKRIVGLLPLYEKTHSHGDFIYDWSWALAYRKLGRSYYPKLMSCLPHTPVSGPRLLVPAGPQGTPIRKALLDGATALAEQCAASSWHLALPDEQDALFLQNQGLLLSHDVQFHWLDADYGDFDGYLATFRADKRRKVRAERRRVEDSGLSIETRHGDEIDPVEWPRLHALYTATFDKFRNRASWSADCLADLAAALGRRMVAFIARDRRVPVAVAICFRDDAALYGRYWGCLNHYPSLHFELCFYQGIAYCLRQGLRRFEPGAGGEHKLARGFVPIPVRSAHWIADPDMRQLLARHLAAQADEVAAYCAQAAEHLPFRRS